jgi:hypothetical protein
LIAAGLIPDRDRHAGQILRPPDRRVGSNEHPGRRDRIGIRIEPPLALRRRDADGPVTRAAYRRLAPTFERLERTDLVAPVVVPAVAGLDQLLEHVVETCVPEVPLLVGNPFLQAEMRLDDEGRFNHFRPPFVAAQTG